MSTTQLAAMEIQEPNQTKSVAPSDSHRPLTDITVELVGHDGNAFSILARVSKALRRGGRRDLVEAFTTEATSGDYSHLLATCHKYVEVG